MRILLLVWESLLFGWKALRSNILRTILSLLGVTVGIFAIISVLTLVDSLDTNIRKSLDFLGSDVIYVNKWPFTGGQGRDWWKAYIDRPYPSYKEYRHLRANLQNASVVCIFANAGNATVKSETSSIAGVQLDGASQDYEKLFDKFIVEHGRYFSSQELDAGRNRVILGYEVAKALFPKGNPIGESVKIKNLKYTIIGVLKQEGESFMGFNSSDYSCIIPYDSFRKIYKTGTGFPYENGSTIGLKGNFSDIGLVNLENEARGQMRVLRGLKPGAIDDFVLNRPEAIGNQLSVAFGVLSIAGWIIGGFSILVGGFGIANIMFVSVKERTSIIGLQKSLGAKNFFILFQFLFESIFLSLIGGIVGVLLVWLFTFAPMGSLDVQLNFQNIVLGLTVSSIIGIVAGIVPAAMAARLDPVIAIRA